MVDVIEMPPTRWGDPAAAAPLSDERRALIEAVFGVDERPARADVAVPAPSIATEVLDALRTSIGADRVVLDDDVRRIRTRGKSTPDLLRQRDGDLSDAPDAVVRPRTHEEVASVLAWAVEHRIAVVPFGGGTSVVGGLIARREGFAGVISLDLIAMQRLVSVDHVSMTATLEPGLRGPAAEALLAAEGVTLGHFPQSFEFGSIGGFAATRSSGQSSAGYGRFDQMVVGVRVATPAGEWRLGSSPFNAAGPDLRQVVLGSEGAFGVITEVTVRVRPVPAEKIYTGWRMPSWEAGSAAMRHLVQRGIQPTVLRLSDETETALFFSGSEPGSCQMIVGYEGEPALVDSRRTIVEQALTELGGSPLGEEPGQHWAEGRYAAPYQRDAMLDLGVLVETLETATFWSNMPNLYGAVRAALAEALPGSLVLCHISHVYETGCSLYFTVVTKAAEDSLGQWLQAKKAACDAIASVHASITHHHAVGTDHQPWLVNEIGDLGVDVLKAVKAVTDPAGILNPGVLIR